MRKLTLLFTLLLCVPCFAASNFKILYDFRGGYNLGVPLNLVLVNNVLYGVAESGPSGGGVYSYDLATHRESVLFSFQGYGSGSGPIGLIWDGQNFYGALEAYGNYCGAVYSLDMAGNETVLYAFTGANGDGCFPQGGVVEDSQGNLYGTTWNGGDATCNCGTVWELSNGVETVLHAFTAGQDGSYPTHTTPVLDSAGNLFGVTYSGGGGPCVTTNQVDGCGVLYEVSNGSYSVVHSFGPTFGGAEGIVIDANDTLWGALFNQEFTIGYENPGAIFSFTSSGQESEQQLAAGRNPADVTLDAAGNLYIVSPSSAPKRGKGGVLQGGVFKRAPDGQVSVLHIFPGNFYHTKKGSFPEAAVVLDSSGTVYGTTFRGGIQKGCNGSCGLLYRIEQ